MTAIFDLLQQDHRKLQELLHKAAATSGSDEGKRQDLLDQIKHEIQVHSKFEEEQFYPAARRATGMDDEIDDDIEEHQEADDILEQLSSMDAASEEWKEKLDQLRDALDHHIHDEEDELFPVAKRKMDSDSSEEIGEAYLERKDQA